MMDEFETDKKSVRRSVHFNAEQKGRVQQLAKQLGYVSGEDGKPNFSRTIHTSTLLAKKHLERREQKIKELKKEIEEWDITIPEVFEIGKVRTLYETLEIDEKKRFITLSEHVKG